MKEFLITSEDDLHQVSGYVVDHLESGCGPLKVKMTNASKRSLSQNSLYWKWLGEISTQTLNRIGQNHDTETFHEYFKQKYCVSSKVSLCAKEVEIRSTKRLSKGEMHHYLLNIEMWSIERGFRLTIPSDSEYNKLKESQNA